MVQNENGLNPYFTLANLHFDYGPFNARCTKVDVEVVKSHSQLQYPHLGLVVSHQFEKD